MASRAIELDFALVAGTPTSSGDEPTDLLESTGSSSPRVVRIITQDELLDYVKETFEDEIKALYEDFMKRRPAFPPSEFVHQKENIGPDTIRKLKSLQSTVFRSSSESIEYSEEEIDRFF